MDEKVVLGFTVAIFCNMSIIFLYCLSFLACSWKRVTACFLFSLLI